MFSKKICAGLCALGMLGAVNANTEVSAANTFQSIVATSRIGPMLWGYFKVMLGSIAYTLSQVEHDSTPYSVVKGLSAFLVWDGCSDVISSWFTLDKAEIKTFEAIAKNDPVYGTAYEVLANNPIELTDNNVKDVIDNVKKLKEAYEKYEDRSLDPTQRLLAKDACEDAAENLKKIASGKTNSKDNDEPQLYKRRRG